MERLPERSREFRVSRGRMATLAFIVGLAAGIYSLAETKTISDILIVPPRAYLSAGVAFIAFLAATWLFARR